MTDTPKFSTYIKRVLKQVHPDTDITSGAMQIMEQLVIYSLDTIIQTGNTLVLEAAPRETTDSRTIQSAVRILLPGELSKHAVAEGTKAVTKYYHGNHGDKETKPKGLKEPKRRESRAGLLFSVARCEERIRQLCVTKRVAAGAPVYLAGVIEYLCSEVLELAGNASRDNKKKRIKPRHIMIAIQNDWELSRLYKHSFMDGGVLPSIHATFVKVSKKKAKKED